LADIFLSYSRKDRDVAALLAEILPTHGWTLYWDRQLLAGEVFDDVLEREINAARCVVVLWSSNSIASQWVRNEADEGASRSQMVSVRIEDIKLPLAFRRIQAADLIGWRGDPSDARLSELVQAIAAILGDRTAERLAVPVSASALPPAAVPVWPQGPPSEQWLAQLKRDLAGYLGPVASIVVSKALRESGSSQELLEKVSSEIPNEGERKQFLKSRRQPNDVSADVPASGAPFKSRATAQAGSIEAERKTAEAPRPPAEQLRTPTSEQPQPAAAIHEGSQAIAAGEGTAAVRQSVEPAAVVAAETRFEEGRSLLNERPHVAERSDAAGPLPVQPTDNASSQTRVKPVVGWSAQAKGMSVAGAIVVLLGVGWGVRSFSSKPVGDLRVSPARINWNIRKGDAPPATQISVEGGSFAFEVTSNPWLVVQPTQGTAPASVTVALKESPGEAGSKDGAVLVRRAGSADAAKTIPVHLQVEAAPGAILVNPATLSLSYLSHSESYPTSQINVSSLAGTLSFSVRVTEGDDWLAVKPSAGVTPAILGVSYHNPPGAALAVGDHMGELRFETEGGQTLLIPVNLTIRNAAPTAPLRVDAKVMDGLLIRRVVPVYPQLARSARVQGPVEFAAVIGKDGSIQNLTLVNGHPLLVKAAQDAVEQFRYKPTLLKGKPIEVSTTIIVRFILTH
jgi:TonB family protein